MHLSMAPYIHHCIPLLHYRLSNCDQPAICLLGMLVFSRRVVCLSIRKSYRYLPSGSIRSQTRPPTLVRKAVATYVERSASVW